MLQRARLTKSCSERRVPHKIAGVSRPNDDPSEYPGRHPGFTGEGTFPPTMPLVAQAPAGEYHLDKGGPRRLAAEHLYWLVNRRPTLSTRIGTNAQFAESDGL